LNRKSENAEMIPPPWMIIPPTMQTYEERGARLLSKSEWEAKCFKCIWGNMANVEIQWDFDKNIKNREATLDDGYLDELCTEGRDEDN